MVTAAILNERNLSYLIRIAECGSFSRAAILLGVTQSVLSRRIRDLENEAGTTIFHRNGRGLVITRDGEMIVELARKVLDDVDRLRLSIETGREAQPDKLIIGLIPSLAASATVPLVRRLSKLLPDTKLHIQEGSSGSLVEWLHDARLDVACLDDGPMLKRFNPVRITGNPLYLTCHRDDITLPPETPIRDLPRYRLVLAAKEHITRRQIEQVAQSRNIKLDVAYESASLWSVMKITDSGLAMSILPYLATSEPGWQRSRLVEPEIVRSLCIATPLKTQNSIPIQRIVSTIKDEVQALYREMQRELLS
ncbi:LysR family transcriptional regulator [Aureimonas mangrovi]|uniref:LysR family transcriptional regulator n=1 Tax=Aureimonas mangrovi TaxID=2758041 RepID=UPI00163D4C18|nr:LysR family transcriptional regulator [Aureimonas mangrovi]